MICSLLLRLFFLLLLLFPHIYFGKGRFFFHCAHQICVNKIIFDSINANLWNVLSIFNSDTSKMACNTHVFRAVLLKFLFFINSFCVGDKKLKYSRNAFQRHLLFHIFLIKLNKGVILISFRRFQKIINYSWLLTKYCTPQL